MSLPIQRTPWSFVSSHPRSLAGSEQGRGVDRRKLARGVAGGEGSVGGNGEQAKANPVVRLEPVKLPHPSNLAAGEPLAGKRPVKPRLPSLTRPGTSVFEFEKPQGVICVDSDS